jgi:hypothetical protein
MANLSVNIREAVSRLLEDKEEITAVGQLSSGLSPKVALLTLGLFSLFTSKYWYAAITNRRVLFVKLTNMSKPDFNATYSVPMSDVHLEGKGLAVQTTNPDLPKYFQFYFGAKRVTGLDKDIFVRALPQAAASPKNLN